MEHERAIEKLSLLEERIAQTAERLFQLKEQYQAMQGQKEVLEREIEDLRSANSELTDRINHLKLMQEAHANSFDKEEVRKKIDRMLEKFGEIQL